MPRPLLVTADPALLDALLRLTAAAGVEPDVAPDPTAARAAWPGAPLVVVGDDVADALVRVAVPRRADVALVGTDLDDAGVWQRGVALGAEHVVFLPDGEEWLVERLAEAARGGPRGRVVGVVGGRGGAGATTLAVALAVAARRGGEQVLLVDADPLGGGLDLALGAEAAPGARWPQLTGGRLTTAVLDDALPRFGELAVLSAGRDDVPVPPERVAALIDTARRAAELVVVDLPRQADDAARAALVRCDAVLLVVPAEVRACAAAARVAAAVCGAVDDVRVVVRLPSPSGLSADLVAESLGLPLAATYRTESGVVAGLERGELTARLTRGSLAKAAASLVAAVRPGRVMGGPAAA